MTLSRRQFLALMTAALLPAAAAPGFAKDGDDNDGGSDNSGSGNSGSDNDDDRDQDSGGNGTSGKDGDDRGSKDEADTDDDNSGKGGWRKAGIARAQEAVRAGRIQPLGEILPTVRQKTPGRVLDVTLLRRGSAYRYEVLVLGPSGVYQEVTVDAATRAILSVRKR